MTTPLANICVAAAMLTLSLPHWTAADDIPVESAPVESARRALDGKVRFPWYDAENDRLRRVDAAPIDSADDANRDSSWQAKSRPSRQWPSWNGGSLLNMIFTTLAWLLVAALLVGLVALTIWAVVRQNDKLAATSPATFDTGKDVDRIENLPFSVKRPQADLLAEARRHYQAGDYGEAIIYLFSYQLVQLDKHQMIRLTRGKTNRQYLGEVRARPGLRDLVANTMIAFEDVFFGRHALSRRRFESCWNSLDDFHRIVEGAAP